MPLAARFSWRAPAGLMLLSMFSGAANASSGAENAAVAAYRLRFDGQSAALLTCVRKATQRSSADALRDLDRIHREMAQSFRGSRTPGGPVFGSMNERASLSRAGRRSLDIAYRDVVAGRAPLSGETTLPSAVIAGLPVDDGIMSCRNVRAVARPVLVRDLAFVAVTVSCAGLCGNGIIYALQRRGSSWRLIATGGEWVS